MNGDASTALKVAGQGGVSNTAGIQTDYTNIAPRIGFSAQIAPGTVLRGGFGLSFFPGNYTSNADLKNAPFVSVYSPGCQSHLAIQIQNAVAGSNQNLVDCGADMTFAAGLPTPIAQTLNSTALSFYAEDPKFKSGVAEQFNLLLEKAFGPNVVSVGYVGVLGRHLPETINDINEPAPNNFTKSTAPGRPLAAVLPGLNGVDWLASEGVSNYNGLQTSFQRRYTNGLTISANYTYAHALSDVVGMSEEGQEGWSDGDPAHIRQTEYGNADNDIRHRFAGTVTYALPFGKGLTGAKKLLMGGWQTNAILAWQTGKPFTIVNNGNDGGYNNRSHGVAINGGVDRPDMYAAGAGPQGDGCLTAFNHDFCPQAIGTVGSEARNPLYGPHFRHLDMSFFKDVPIKESLKVQFRTEIFNISNTPNYYVNNNVNSSPATLLGNGSFGKVLGTDPVYTPRQFQFVLKILF